MDVAGEIGCLCGIINSNKAVFSRDDDQVD
jgi:hypothetical protein